MAVGSLSRNYSSRILVSLDIAYAPLPIFARRIRPSAATDRIRSASASSSGAYHFERSEQVHLVTTPWKIGARNPELNQGGAVALSPKHAERALCRAHRHVLASVVTSATACARLIPTPLCVSSARIGCAGCGALWGLTGAATSATSAVIRTAPSVRACGGTGLGTRRGEWPPRVPGASAPLGSGSFRSCLSAPRGIRETGVGRAMP